jgi:hypothetical protein
LFATGGAGFGFAAIGGAGFAPGAGEAEGVVFFHGAADPFDGAIPGNTDTGFADASAVSGEARPTAAFAGAGFARGGGGGAAAAAGAGAGSR